MERSVVVSAGGKQRLIKDSADAYLGDYPHSMVTMMVVVRGQWHFREMLYSDWDYQAVCLVP